MKKVLFLGPYRQKDHWGQAARDYIRALISNANIQLSSRPIYYSKFIESSIDGEIEKTEHVYHNKYDVIIQHGFPSSFNINSHAKNIGLLNIEFSKGTSDINSLILNRLDEIYVATEHEKNALLYMGVKTPVQIVSRPMDIDNVAKNYQPNQKISLPNFVNSTFKFYCQTSAEERGNLDILVTAFYLAFGEQDRASLIIAPNVPSDSSSHRLNIEKLCNDIKNRLRTNKVFKNEIILPNQYGLSEEIALHNTGDCYININSGSNYDMSMVLAMCLGKTPIVMSNTGLESLMDGEKGGFVVKSDNHPIMLESPPLPEEYDLFNANYFWKKPNIQSLIEVLKKVYHAYKNDNNSLKNKQKYNLENINKFSYTSIGQNLCL